MILGHSSSSSKSRDSATTQQQQQILAQLAAGGFDHHSAAALQALQHQILRGRWFVFMFQLSNDYKVGINFAFFF